MFFMCLGLFVGTYSWWATRERRNVSSWLYYNLEAGSTSLELFDASLFPSFGTIIINGSEIRYNGKVRDGLTGLENVCSCYNALTTVESKDKQVWIKRLEWQENG